MFSFVGALLLVIQFQPEAPTLECQPLDADSVALIDMISTGNREALRSYLPNGIYEGEDFERLERFVFGPNGDYRSLADVAAAPDALCQLRVIGTFPDGNNFPERPRHTLYILNRAMASDLIADHLQTGHLESWFACEFVRTADGYKVPEPEGRIMTPFCFFETGGPFHDYG